MPHCWLFLVNGPILAEVEAEIVRASPDWIDHFYVLKAEWAWQLAADH